MHVKNYVQKLGVACNIKSQGIDKDAWEESVHRMAMNAYEDQCTPSKPKNAYGT